jgi:hypothetical protein
LNRTPNRTIRGFMISVIALKFDACTYRDECVDRFMSDSTRRSKQFGKADQRPLRTEWIRAASARFAGVGEVRTRSSITRSLSASRFIAR